MVSNKSKLGNHTYHKLGLGILEVTLTSLEFLPGILVLVRFSPQLVLQHAMVAVGNKQSDRDVSASSPEPHYSSAFFLYRIQSKPILYPSIEAVHFALTPLESCFDIGLTVGSIELDLCVSTNRVTVL